MRYCFLVAFTLACGSPHASPEAWGTSDYVAAGVPDPAQPWTTAGIEKASDVIAQAATGHADRLPRYKGPKSGTVFARLVAAPADEQAASPTAQLGTHLVRFEALNKASKLYANGLLPPPREQIEIFDALLHEAAAISALSEPFLASFSADDPSLPARRAGLDKFYTGVGGMLLGSVMIADNRGVGEDNRLVVFRYLADTAPALLPRIPADQQQQIRSYVGKLVEATSGKIHNAAVRLNDALK
jgi:hypothetical protein